MLLMIGLLGGFGGVAEASEVGSRPFGLGVVLGDPTGLSAKLYLGSGANAIDFALAFDTYDSRDRYDGDALYFHATYLWHPSVLASGSVAEMPWHVGVGGFAESDRFGGRNDGYDDGIGVRVPIGLDVNLEGAPIQFFGDIALRVGILPGTYIDFDLGLGARYYF